MKKVVIIGGGPAGLSAAYLINKKYPETKVKVFEKAGIFGGCGRTESNGNIVFDMGPHYFYTNNQRVMNFFYEIMNKDQFIACYKNALISTLGKYFDYPIRLNANSIINLGSRIFKVGITWLLRKRCTSHANLEDYFIHNYGTELYRLFFEKYTQKVWGFHPSNLPYDFLGQRIEKDGLIDILRNTFSKKRYAFADTDNLEEFFLRHFLYLPNGSGQFWDELIRKCDKNVEFVGDVNVTNIDCKTCTVTYEIGNDRYEEKYDNIICTNPLDETLEYIGADEKYKNLFKKYMVFRSLIFVNLEVSDIFIKNYDYRKVHYIYLHDDNLLTGRITFYSNWSDKMAQDGKVSCCLEYYCNPDDSKYNLSDDEVYNIALKDMLTAQFIESDKQVYSYAIRRFPKCYPITLDKTERSTVVNFVEKQGINLIGRMGRHEYISMAKCIEQAINLCDKMVD